jgi:hypothetical protein
MRHAFRLASAHSSNLEAEATHHAVALDVDVSGGGGNK